MENLVVIWDTIISLRIRLWEIQKQRIIKGSLINYIKTTLTGFTSFILVHKNSLSLVPQTLKWKLV